MISLEGTKGAEETPLIKIEKLTVDMHCIICTYWEALYAKSANPPNHKPYTYPVLKPLNATDS